jgi:arylsulfatase A-like enzyme
VAEPVLAPGKRRLVTTRAALAAWTGVAVLTCSSPSGGGAPVFPERPPNVVLILLDDLGYDDIAIHGNRLVETPHIDALAGESVRFESFYVTPVCATTRAALLTGRHHLRTGVSHVHGGKDYVDLGETLLPQPLREAGYATGMWGKWHVGTGDGYMPWQRGFDEAFVARLYRYFDNQGATNGEPDPQTGWTPERLTDKAIDFMTRHRDRPLFAYLPYLTVHSPLDAPQELVERYRAKGLDGALAVLYAMVDGLDGQLGRLLESLETLGVADHTVVLFMSDNGPWVGTSTLTEDEHRLRYVSGMRGHKGDLWENGVRSPLFVRWKGRLAPRVVDRAVDVADLFPTILDLAGVEEPGGRALDGRSLLPLLEGEEPEPDGRRIYRYAHPGWISGERPWTPEGLPGEYAPVDKANLVFERQALALWDGRYKLLLNPLATDHEGETEVAHVFLVDLQEDPREQTNRADREPDRAAAMQAELRSWWNEILAEAASFRPPVFPVGFEGRATTRIKACAPASVAGGLTNSFLYVTGWRVGGTADYRIDVHTRGEYEVTLEFQGEAPRGVTFLVGTTSGRRPLRVSAEGRETPARVALPTGPNVLTVELEDAGDAGRTARARLGTVVLHRR